MRKDSQLEFEISFYETLVSDKPDFIDALIPLAENYTKAAMYQKGLEIDKRLARLCPDDSSVLYNLACSYSLVGELEGSLCALERAIRSGYSDVTHMLRDPDLKSIRSNEKFVSLAQKIKDCKKA